MAYEKQWASTQPGCIIFLLDQSGSMDESFGGSQVGAGRQKKDVVATVLNNFLNELKKTNTVGVEVRPRADVAVLGYSGRGAGRALSGPLAGKDFVTLPELQDNPVRIEVRSRKEMDDSGNIVELPDYFPIWVEAAADGGTPMGEALRQARQLAEAWVAAHPGSYPPVIVNVTDGMATDSGDDELRRLAEALRNVSTSDGQALLCNCHITSLSRPEVDFPSAEAEVPNDRYARLLYAMSSAIPDSARANIRASVGVDLPAGARFFIFHGDAASVRQMFVFASLSATLDPNR
ncbi:MAG: VWA domain-containing protein [Anaerolineae bacterium]